MASSLQWCIGKAYLAARILIILMIVLRTVEKSLEIKEKQLCGAG